MYARKLTRYLPLSRNSWDLMTAMRLKELRAHFPPSSFLKRMVLPMKISSFRVIYKSGYLALPEKQLMNTSWP